MRKLIAIIVVSLVPIGMWTAGCRQDNRQAAFPNNNSEVKGLAGAGAARDKNKPPRIDPAPIDREILNMPESHAMARADAVKDKSKQMAGTRSPDELFTLPDMGAPMASAPGYDSRPADIAPPAQGREFWSRPSGGSGFKRSGPVPEGVSAMAPADAESGFMAPPVQFIPPPAAKPKADNGSGPMPLGDVPGVFMDGGTPMSMRSGSPPASRQQLKTSSPGGDALGAPPSLTKRGNTTKAEKPAAIAPEQKGPVKLDLSGILGSKQYDPPPAAVLPAPEPPSYAFSGPDINGGFLHGSVVNPAIVVHSIPGDYEPLPEPIPIEEYQAMLGGPLTPVSSGQMQLPKTSVVMPQPQRKTVVPLAAAPLPPGVKGGGPESFVLPAPPVQKAMPAPKAKAPAAKKETVAVAGPPPKEAPAMVKAADILKALAPLPDISSKDPAEKTPETVRKTASTVSLPPPLPVTTPDLAAAKSALESVSVLAGSEAATAGAARDKDFFKTDFWEKTGSGMGAGFDLELPEPKKTPPAQKAEVAGKSVEKKHDAPELGISSNIKKIEKNTAVAAALPELRPQPPVWVEEAKVEAPAKPQEVKNEEPAAAKKEPPKKVKLLPARKHNDKDLSKIDAAMEVPPMRF